MFSNISKQIFQSTEKILIKGQVEQFYNQIMRRTPSLFDGLHKFGWLESERCINRNNCFCFKIPMGTAHFHSVRVLRILKVWKCNKIPIGKQYRNKSDLVFSLKLKIYLLCNNSILMVVFSTKTRFHPYQTATVWYTSK